MKLFGKQMGKAELTFVEGSRSGYVKRESRHCLRCNYIGPRHLCGCMGELGEALKQGHLDHARSLYEDIVRRANDDLQARTVWDD
jgi:hypothetical protein